MTLLQNLESRLATALESVLGEPIEANLKPAADLRFGDYQSNSAMVLAKRLKTNPRELAQKIIDAIDIEGLASAKIDGPGFINFTIFPEAFAAHAESLLKDARLGVPEPGKGKRVVVDFSAPNVAKPMHVGHIRSTIIGDSLCRIARFLGFDVIADNHIGDWGTQFGMILHGWKTLLNHDALEEDPIAELVRVYREVNAATKDDPSVLETCKGELVRLQAGWAKVFTIQCSQNWLMNSLRKDSPAKAMAQFVFFLTKRKSPDRTLSKFSAMVNGGKTQPSSGKRTVDFSMPLLISRRSNIASTNGMRTKFGMSSAFLSNCISASFLKQRSAGGKLVISDTLASAQFSAKTKS